MCICEKSIPQLHRRGMKTAPVRSSDVILQCKDGICVPAARFILAARSEVFKRMLCGGDFFMKTRSVVPVMYDSWTMGKIVQYSGGSEVELFDGIETVEGKVDKMLNLVAAAAFFRLNELAELAVSKASLATKGTMELAVAVHGVMAANARGQVRRKVQCLLLHPGALKSSWLLSLSGELLVPIMRDMVHVPTVPPGCASEWRKYEFILQWMNARPQNGASDGDRYELAKKASDFIALEGIPPSKLSVEVVNSKLVSQERLLAAFRTQALWMERLDRQRALLSGGIDERDVSLARQAFPLAFRHEMLYPPTSSSAVHAMYPVFLLPLETSADDFLDLSLATWEQSSHWSV